jgi:hypothetical protein
MMDSKYTKAAIIIQRWWRTKYKLNEDEHEEPEHEILTINNNTYIWELLYSFARFVYYKIYYYTA